MDSILTSIKKLLGITEEYDHFDADIIMHINSVFGILTQIGVGPTAGFYIKDKSAKWTDFLPEDAKLEMVKSYVYLKVRLLFDPPQASSLAEAIKNNAAELEWRISVTVDPGDTFQA